MVNQDYDDLFKSLDEASDNAIKYVDKLIDTSVPKLTSLLNDLSDWLKSKL